MPARGRLPRVVPKQAPPLIVDGQVVPPGVSPPLDTMLCFSALTTRSRPLSGCPCTPCTQAPSSGVPTRLPSALSAGSRPTGREIRISLRSTFVRSVRGVGAVLGSSKSCRIRRCVYQILYLVGFVAANGIFVCSVAYAEIFMTLAYVFRTFDMRLRTTKPRLRELFTMSFQGGMWIDFEETGA